MLLGIGIYFLIPLKLFAFSSQTLSSEEWYNHITQFDNGFARAEVGDLAEFTSEFLILIEEEPSHEFDGFYIEYDFTNAQNLTYFDSQIHPVFNYLYENRFDEAYQYLLSLNYEGYLHWNFEEHYWQIEFFGDELEYYKEQYFVLKDEIQQLEEALNTEFDRGYNEGYNNGYDEGILAGDYQEGYQEGYQDGFIDGEKSKIAKNNEFFYNNIAIWIPAVITLVVLASIISYLGLKRKNE